VFSDPKARLAGEGYVLLKCESPRKIVFENGFAGRRKNRNGRINRINNIPANLNDSFNRNFFIRIENK